jgi:NADH:ubiquinone oxidoreductase subunit H
MRENAYSGPLLVLLLILLAPATARAGEPLSVVDVWPPRLEVYSQLEVSLSSVDGVDLAAPARLHLDGALRSTGEGGHLDLKVPATWRRDTLVYPVDRRLVEAVGRRHVTFDGVVTVDIALKDGGRVELKSKQTSLQIFPVGIQNALALGTTVNGEEARVPWLLLIVLFGVIGFALLLGVFAPFAGITSYVERRIAGRIQNRIGPNRVGPQGFLQWLADGIKTFQKEDIIPPGTSPFLFRTAPYFVMAGVFLTFVHLPFSQALVVADIDIGVFYILAVTSVVVVGIIAGGWASNNKWSLLGGFRSAAQMISYEIPLALSVLAVATVSGHLSLQRIVEAQGPWPWQWNLCANPALTVGFVIFFIASLAEGNRAPFDLPEAESELVSGYNTEYSGMRFLFFFFAEWGNLYVMGALATLLFLGGWQIPGVSPLQMEGSFLLQLIGVGVLVAKVFAMVFVIIWVRWTLPRIRIDQMMAMCWQYLIPAGFGVFLVTAAWMVFVPAVVQTGVSWLLFAGIVGLIALFISRVRYNLRATPLSEKGFSGDLPY